MDDHLNSCLLVLEHDPNIARALIFMLKCVDDISFLVTKEMTACQKDIKYWTYISKQDPFYAAMSKNYINFHRRRFQSTTQQAFADENADRNIIILRHHFTQLSKNLARVSDIASELRIIILELDKVMPISIIDDRVIISDDFIEECLTIARHHLVNAFKKLKIVLNDLSSSSTTNQNPNRSFTRYLGAIMSPRRQLLFTGRSYSVTNFDANNSMKDDDLELKVLLTGIHKIYSRLMQNRTHPYPLDTVKSECRRPSINERYWLPNLFLFLGTCYISAELIRMTQNGSLQKFIHTTYITISKQLTERIIEPVSNLSHELFETISRRQEGIVTREDLEQSRQALNRMLEDFIRAHKAGLTGFNILTNPMQVLTDTRMTISSHIPNPLSSSSSSGGNASVTTDTISSAAVLTPQILPISPPPPTTSTHTPSSSSSSDLNLENVMDLLMKNFEDEVKKPITSLVFGNLMTTMLIQMQKLKVHTESALLTMDQVLASNQLTMAGTAAMPAFLFFGATGYWIYRIFVPRPPKPGKTTAKLRLAMSDLERNMVSLYTNNMMHMCHTDASVPSNTGNAITMVCRTCQLRQSKSATNITNSTTNEPTFNYSSNSPTGPYVTTKNNNDQFASFRSPMISPNTTHVPLSNTYPPSYHSPISKMPSSPGSKIPISARSTKRTQQYTNNNTSKLQQYTRQRSNSGTLSPSPTRLNGNSSSNSNNNEVDSRISSPNHFFDKLQLWGGHPNINKAIIYRKMYKNNTSNTSVNTSNTSNIPRYTARLSSTSVPAYSPRQTIYTTSYRPGYTNSTINSVNEPSSSVPSSSTSVPTTNYLYAPADIRNTSSSSNVLLEENINSPTVYYEEGVETVVPASSVPQTEVHVPFSEQKVEESEESVMKPISRMNTVSSVDMSSTAVNVPTLPLNSSNNNITTTTSSTPLSTAKLSPKVIPLKLPTLDTQSDNYTTLPYNNPTIEIPRRSTEEYYLDKFIHQYGLYLFSLYRFRMEINQLFLGRSYHWGFRSLLKRIFKNMILYIPKLLSMNRWTANSTSYSSTSSMIMNTSRVNMSTLMSTLLSWTASTGGGYTNNHMNDILFHPLYPFQSTLLYANRLPFIYNTQMLIEEIQPQGEYASLCRDIQLLMESDDIVCGCMKLAVIQRMRVSYQCLIPPVQ